MWNRHKTYQRQNMFLVFFVFGLVLVLIYARLGYLMMYRADYYGVKAKELHERERKIKAERGKILDRNGNLLAGNRSVSTISVIHSQIKEPEKVISLLSKELGMSEEVIRKKVEKVSNKKNSTSSKQKTSSKSTNGRKSTSKSSNARKSVNKAALKDEDIIVVKQTELDDNSLIPQDATKKHKTWPFVVIFGLLSVLMTLAFIAWGAEGFNVKVFDNATKAVSEFKIFGFQLFGKLLGTVNSFGNWTIMDLTLPIILSVVLLALIYKVKVNDIFDGFVEGAKRSLGVAFISILVYTILVIVTYHPFQLVIYKAILGLSKGFNIATTSIVAIIASLINGDSSYVFQSVLPYYTSAVTNVDNYSTVGVIFQAMYGLSMLIAPTSVVLMGVLSYLEVSYGEWLKRVWKLLLELFIFLLIIFIILDLIFLGRLIINNVLLDEVNFRLYTFSLFLILSSIFNATSLFTTTMKTLLPIAIFSSKTLPI